MRRLFLISIGLLIISTLAFVGNLLTNTNQHILFLRVLARDASIQIDAVYPNPAGVAFMGNGFHLSLNGQSASQTKTITSTFVPFASFGGNATEVYKGETLAPFIPSVFAAYKKDKWTFSADFAITGGGGRATFNEGLGSFESQVAMIPKLLKKQGFVADKYSVNSFMGGKQYIFSLQLGATYKITDYLSVFGGARINYVSSVYSGHLRDIQANIRGDDKLVNLNNYFTTLVAGAVVATEKFEPGSPEYIKYMTDAARTSAVANGTANMELDCKQSGWGTTPIIGADFKMGRWNVGVKCEFSAKLNVENKTKGTLSAAPADPTKDKFANYRDGASTPHDIPSLLTVGASYEILPVLRTSIGYHHFFDTYTKMATVRDPATGTLVDKHNYIGDGANEYLADMGWDICEWAQISADMRRTKYEVKDNHQSDTGFAVGSYLYSFGVGFNVAKSLKLNIAYLWADYDKYTKDISNHNDTGTPGKDVFIRTNKIFGIGLDYKF